MTNKKMVKVKILKPCRFDPLYISAGPGEYAIIPPEKAEKAVEMGRAEYVKTSPVKKAK